MSYNPSHALMCCCGCGRDTCSSTGYCAKCTGRGIAAGVREQKGRKQRSMKAREHETASDEAMSDYAATKEQSQ